MLTLVLAPKGASNSILERDRRPARLWPVLVAVLAGFTGLSAQAEPVAISPGGVRASAVDIAYDAEGTAWLLWVQKGARIPGAGHASADDLYLTRWPADAPPEAPIKVNTDTGQVRASALSIAIRARLSAEALTWPASAFTLIGASGGASAGHRVRYKSSAEACPAPGMRAPFCTHRSHAVPSAS